MKRIYGVIIGTEILNGRRKDKHFAFLLSALQKYGWDLHANFIIKDDPLLIKQTFEFISQDKDAVLFCFGGIGATPDDLTREIAANVFTKKECELHAQALELIKKEFGSDAYPHRIQMAKLPKRSTLLTNVVNQVPGFAVDERFFFMPGFPSMAHPMVEEALQTYIGQTKRECYTYSFIANTGESDLIDLMTALPKEINLSSLPRLQDDGSRTVEIHISAYDKSLIDTWSTFLVDSIKAIGITILETKDPHGHQ